MQLSTIKIYLSTFFLLLIFLGFSVHAQQLHSFNGQVKRADGTPVYGAGIQVRSTGKTSLTDKAGKFRLTLASGTYTLRITHIGFTALDRKITVPAEGNPELQFILKDSEQDLSEVSVIGRTVAQETNRQAFNVSAIDAKKLYNTTLDISGALDRVAGIRVRESGGVGSNFNLSLNGFSGNHVKYFIDGIPMDNFGSSFQINNIPINIAERVEVYKGVVPMWLGSDALGGAVNIVTGDKYRNYFDASYSFGSFIPIVR